MNPTLRGFILMALVAGAIVALSLEESLFAINSLLRIAFFLAVAFFVFLMWRERRDEIGAWSSRSQWVFYGAAILIIVDLGAFLWWGAAGVAALAFILVLVLCAFSMYRVWKDEHTYGV
jgi:hypothetical protein